MLFTITYADADGKRPVRSDSINADDIDAAARQAVDTCPDSWFVVKVEQSDSAPDARVAHSPTFQRYIERGERAARSHPDYDTLDPTTTATDTIASIPHWVQEVLDDELDGGAFDAETLLRAAHTSYVGDFEDDEPAPREPVMLVTRTDYNGAPVQGAPFGWVVVDGGGKPLTNPYGDRSFAAEVVAWFAIPAGLVRVALEWPGA